MVMETRGNKPDADIEEKIATSKEVIREALKGFCGEIVIAWTGGKDSTTMLGVYKQVIGSPLQHP